MDDHLKLETDLAILGHGDLTTTKFVLVARSVGFNICETTIRKTRFFCDASLPLHDGAYALFHGEFQRINGKHWIKATAQTVVLPVPKPSVEGLHRIVEGCAGLAVVDQGYKACGAQILAHVESNSHYCGWLKKHGAQSVIHGNVARMQTVEETLKVVQQSHTLSGGFSCQPFSVLGDQQQQHDPRSESLPGLLRMAHYLGSVAIVLECTKEAMSSQWVKDCIRQFTDATGYRCTENVLHLQHTWPSLRTRWWAILSHPELGQPYIPDMPAHRFLPTISHLIPHMMRLGGDDLQQLQLDDQELKLFDTYKGGIHKSCINPFKAMPTATHSWGSQGSACFCGCRDRGFSHRRLQDRGLYAALIINQPDETVRHPHPQEIALLNGLEPSHFDAHEQLRLQLSGAGQMASPLQGAWVLSNLQWQVAEQQLLPETRHPRVVMLTSCFKLLKERDELWPNIQILPTMKIFLREIIAIVSPTIFEPPYEEQPTNQQAPPEEPNTQDFLAECERVEQELQLESGTAVQPPPEADQHDHAVKKIPKPSCAPGLKPSRAIACLPVETDRTMHPTRATEKTSPAEVSPSIFISNHDPTFATGAVPGFSSTPVSTPTHAMTTKLTEPDPAPAADETMAEAEVEDEAEEPPSEVEAPPEPAPEAEPRYQGVLHVVRNDGGIHTMSCTFPLIAQQFIEAECALDLSGTEFQVQTAMGTLITEQQALQPEQFLLVHDGPTTFQTTIGQANADVPRGHLLWHQQGWVAFDEMQFYADVINVSHPQFVFDVLDTMDDFDAPFMFTTRIMAAAADAEKSGSNRGLLVLHNKHWTPVHVQVTPQEPTAQVTITTTAESIDMITNWCNFALHMHPFVLQSTPSVAAFPNDCGFQAIAWLLAVVANKPCEPMPEQQACHWRSWFFQRLLNDGTVQTPVKPGLRFGGGPGVKEPLLRLIVQHGVAESRSNECADALIRALGAQNVSTILQSPKPWQDLKSRSSMLQPPIRIVTAEELQAQIAARVKSSKPIGKKHNKSKPLSTTSNQIRLQSDQITVPHAVFKQDDGQEVGQLLPQQLGPRAQGVMIVTIEEALPYFNLTSPVSTEGVGLLILDPFDQRLPSQRQVIQVPAHCKATGEPMLVKMAMVQLGTKAIQRNLPQNCPAVQQVANTVARIVVFQDQWSQSWEEFCQKPVRAILTHVNFQGLASEDILDVWDRQWLTSRLTKSQPKAAACFAVNVRLTAPAYASVASTSGTDGIYIEPRSPDGRAPDAAFQVIWLPKRSFADTVLAQKTVDAPTTLVRNADRYGLRVSQAHAEKVHGVFKPEVPWLPGAELKRFRVGPMPYGATRASLVQVCRLWEWKARPVSPISQTTDRLGSIWLFQSPDLPPSWIYQMQHGEILITQEADANPVQPDQPTLLASNRTVQSLKKPEGATSSEDPWVHHDPWQPSRGKEISVGQMQALEMKLEQKIEDRLGAKTKEDAEMTPIQDPRVTELEQQIEQLSASVSQFQQSQTSQNQLVQQQLVQLDQKVDQQSTAFAGVLDTKLDDAMRRIEAMLRKRPAEDKE
eukprot:Skav230725  [mRNA]  locus=scaffold401:87585:92222:- [translate_table: standard]